MGLLEGCYKALDLNSHLGSCDLKALFIVILFIAVVLKVSCPPNVTYKV